MTCADSRARKAARSFRSGLPAACTKAAFPSQGPYAAARLEALREEIPEGMAEDHRELHAKWVLLRGPRTAVILMGSANFTRKGFGVVRRPEQANIEACVLLHNACGGGGPADPGCPPSPKKASLIWPRARRASSRNRRRRRSQFALA